MSTDRYIEEACEHFAAAEQAWIVAKRDLVLTDGDDMQYQMLSGIGKLLLRISDQLAYPQGPKPGSWAGR